MVVEVGPTKATLTNKSEVSQNKEVQLFNQVRSNEMSSTFELRTLRSGYYFLLMYKGKTFLSKVSSSDQNSFKISIDLFF